MRFITVSLLITCFIRTTFCQGSGGQNGTLQVDGTTRDYIVYAPASGLPQHPLLILALHPLGGTNTQFRSMSGWNTFADREKFVVVYPQGITPITMNGQKLIGWDITSDTDVHFMTDLIDTMAARYAVDRNRVYPTGFSMGGMLSYVLACRVSDKIAAIGPDAGYPVGQNANSCKPSVPVPVCHVHGADDDFVTYSGVAPWVEKFATVNGCSASPVTTNPSSKAKKEDWTPCDDDNDVIFYTVAGMGHDYATASKYSFSATDTFWNFFKTHARNGATGAIVNPLNTPQLHNAFSAAYSNGTLRLHLVRDVLAISVVDLQGREIFSRKTPVPAGTVSLPVNRSSGGIAIVTISEPSGCSIQCLALY